MSSPTACLGCLTGGGVSEGKGRSRRQRAHQSGQPESPGPSLLGGTARAPAGHPLKILSRPRQQHGHPEQGVSKAPKKRPAAS
eukprot:jgi/Mesen1/5882/ME000299S05002